MSTKTTIAALTKQAENAAATAREAQAKLAEAEATNYAEATKARQAAAGAWRETYDPAADVDAIRAAANNLMDAMRNTELGAAFLAFAHANMTAAARYRRAQNHDNLNGGPLAGGPQFKPRDLNGRPLAHFDFETYLNGVLARVAYTLADEAAEAEAEAVEAQLQAAYDSAAPSSPVAYRITTPEPRTMASTVGAFVVQFVDGIAYTPEGPARYYERKGFKVEPVWSVPDSYNEAAAHVRGELVTTTHTPEVSVRPATANDLRRSIRG